MIIAMAGLAEAAIFFQLLIAAVILLVVTGLLALAWWKRSWVATIIGCVFMLIAGALLQPWVVFRSAGSDDPDEMDLLVKYRIASVIWALLPHRRDGNGGPCPKSKTGSPEIPVSHHRRDSLWRRLKP